MAPIGVLFLLSGLTGLAYEVLWFRYLGNLLGHGGAAQAVVLATFLGGLALGYALLGPRADRAAMPLRTYAKLELGLGAYGVAFPAAFWLVELAYPGNGLGWRVAAAILVLLPPTTLMGGTLPALARQLVALGRSPREAVATLYALNGLGAAAGSLLTSYALIPTLGLDGACIATGLLNLATGAAAWRLAAPVPPADAASAGGTASQGVIRWIQAAALASGVLALALEVAWTRLLTMVLGATTHAFALMLAGTILGIAAGGWLAARRRLEGRDPLALFAAAQAGAALAITLMAPWYELVPYLFLRLDGWLPRTTAGYACSEAGKLALGLAAVGLPAACLGLALPLATAVAARGPVGAAVGRVFALNTLGCVLGAVLTGAWFMPALGLAAVFVAVALGCAVLAAGSIWALAAVRPRDRLALLTPPLAAALILATLWEGWPLPAFYSGGGQRVLAPGVGFGAFHEAAAAEPVLFSRDDLDASVAVTLTDGDLMLRTNGRGDASARTDLPTQVLLGQLPTLLTGGTGNALLVGLGTGMTAGSLLTHPLGRLDVVELDAAVPEAARAFAGVNHDALADPRLHLINDDALAYLRTTPQTYDMIVSQPSHVWVAGVANLFSREAYAAARARLRPGGVFVQWCQGFATTDAALRLALNTFGEAFPHVTAWQGLADDVLLVGSEQPIQPSRAALERAYAAGTRELQRAHVGKLTTFLATQLLDEPALRRQLQPAPINTLRFPALEAEAPRGLFLGKPATRLQAVDRRRGLATDLYGELVLGSYLAARGKPLQPDELADLVGYQLQTVGRLPVAQAALEAWRAKYPQDRRPRWLEARIAIGVGLVDQGLAQLEALVAEAPKDAGVRLQAVDQLAGSGTVKPADRPKVLAALARHADALAALQPALKPMLALRRARVLVACGELTPAADQLDTIQAGASAPAEELRDGWWAIATRALAARDPELATRAAKKVLAIDPQHAGAQALLQKS